MWLPIFSSCLLVGIFGPGVEAPFDRESSGADSSLGPSLEPRGDRRPRLSGHKPKQYTNVHPESRVQTRFVGQRWKRIFSLRALALVQILRARFFGRRIIDDQFDPLVPRQMANDFGVHPWNGLELARPVVAVVRPSQPGGVVRLPFGGHAVTAVSIQVQVTSTARRSFQAAAYSVDQPAGDSAHSCRCDGHAGTASCGGCLPARFRSTSPTRISSLSCEASAITRPNGSHRNDPPQNSSPAPGADLPRISPFSFPRD